jgi:hypothetical protein
MKKGLILITFAWAVEVIGVTAGLVNAVYTTYPTGNLPESWWLRLAILPMTMLALAELGRVPLASVLFHRHRIIQAVAISGMIVLGYLAFENWTFGFERIVELRMKPVSDANLVLSQAGDNLKDLESQRDNAATGDKARRDELQSKIAEEEAIIKTETERHQAQLKANLDSCKVVRERCLLKLNQEENARFDKAIGLPRKDRDELQHQINDMIKSDHGDATKLEKQIAEADRAVSVAKKARDEQISQNQIYRLAASYFRKDPADVQPKEFELARWVFSTFSAIAVALAGSVAALVYYAQERVPGEPLFLAKIARARRAYYARKRRPIFRDVPVEKIIYRDGKEPPTILEKEVVKWIDRIVLIPRWGLRAPVYANSLVRDEPNVTALKKAN